MSDDTLTLLKSLGISRGIAPYGHLSVLQQSPFRIPKITSPNQRWWTKLNKNKLTIKINDLLHTREQRFGGEYRIAPLNSGKYQIKISVICEEYDDCQEQIIEIDI